MKSRNLLRAAAGSLLVAIACATGCSWLPPIKYEAKVINKQVLCGRYCEPTVAFQQASGITEDRVYSLALYTGIEVGRSYVLQQPSPARGRLASAAAGTLFSAVVFMIFGLLMRSKEEDAEITAAATAAHHAKYGITPR